jgi:hypothetical protein
VVESIGFEEDRVATNESQVTPRQHAQHIAELMRQAESECRADLRRVDDPKAQALFVTLAEVLLGGIKALEDYAGQREEVWKARAR